MAGAPESNTRSSTKRRSASPVQHSCAKEISREARQPANATRENDWTNDMPLSSFDSSILSFSQPTPSANMPPWAIQLMEDTALFRRKLDQQEQEFKEHKEELENMRALIAENKELRTALATANARIAELERVARPSVTPIGNTNPMEVDARQDLMGSRHAPTEEEWEDGRLEREKQRAEKDKQRQEQQRRKDERMQRQFDLLERKQQNQQQPQKEEQQRSQGGAPSYASVTSRRLPPKKRTVNKLTGTPSEKQVQWAQRVFAPSKETSTEYTIVYMSSPRKTLHSEIRRALRLLGVAHERVIDVHFPAHGVVGLLVNKTYEQDLRTLLQKAKVKTNDDFNPISESAIGDAKWRAKSVEERVAFAKLLYQERILGICLRMPKTHLGFAILRHFNQLTEDDHHHVGDAYLAKFQEQHPKPARQPRPILVSTQDARQLLGVDLGTRVDKEDAEMEDQSSAPAV
ncbi:hypothetical protein BJV82DRAFT_586283 [Fennellomyces sp. T-0311]|nr:hypothetical protein BJV82DRAFT_586283 [Fennellomyces sp. T-0311]